MGKKKLDVMAKEREIFIHGQTDENGNVVIPGCVRNGIDEASANKIFDEMAEFAKYAFNKSHAAAYAVVSYRTAYLKTYYPVEFMAATLNSFLGNLDKIPEYIAECKRTNIEILKPSINQSYTKFAVYGNQIRFGLGSIKNVGTSAVEYIVAERKKNGEYKSFTDFCERVQVETINKKCIESLIKAGAFDELGETRHTLLENFEAILDTISNASKRSLQGQVTMFDMQLEEDVDKHKYNINQKPEYDERTLLDMEKEMLGLYISGHPLDEYKEYISKNSTATTIEINSSAQLENEEETNTNYDEKVVTICGIFKRGKLLITKSRKNMMFAELEDLYGTVELVLFPNIFEKYERVLLDDCIIKVTGKVSIKEDEKAKILVSNLVLIDNEIKNKKDTDTIKIKEDKKIYIRIPKDKFELEDRVIGYIKDLSREYHGYLPVYIFYDGTNKLRLLNKINYLQDNNIVIEKLELAFGKENVKIK